MNFKESKVRVVLDKNFKDDPVIVMRGSVIDEAEQGLLITGRIFMKVLEEDKMVEKPIDDETKLLFVPFGSIRFLEFIVSGSKYELLNKKITREAPLPSSKIDREGAF
ncbi:MAG: hypothetical protein PHQ54_00680 [Candidatus Omnitrophica bacterium]|nr:hypothetical protein [Candidatus Omnitrophota bacterium]